MEKNYLALDVNLKHIFYFLTVAETGNVTQAAKKLYVTQPQLSKKLMALEQQLGLPLFVRKGRKIRLTEAGLYLYEKWTALLECYNRELDSARLVGRPVPRRLRIGCFPILQTNAFLFPYVEEIRRLEPDIHIQVVRKNYNLLLEELSGERLDLVFVPEEDMPVVRNMLEWMPVRSFPFAAAVPEDHPLAQADHLTYMDLNGEDLFYTNPEGMLSRVPRFQKMSEKFHLIPRSLVYENNDITTFLNAELGMGIAIGLRPMFPEDSSHVKIFELPGAKVRIMALWSKKESSGFRELLKAALRAASAAYAKKDIM